MDSDGIIALLSKPCDLIPLVHPDAIQPHGLFLALEVGTHRLRVVSENCRLWLGKDPSDVIGAHLNELFSHESAQALGREFEKSRARNHIGPLKVKFEVPSRRISHTAILHRSGPFEIIEIEASSSSGPSPLRDDHIHLRRAMEEMSAAKDLLDLCHQVTLEVARLTGFDRVLAYRFDSEWNGEVVAEVLSGALPPLAGLHFTASDIPAQARELYSANRMRFVPDTAYRPSNLHVCPTLTEPISLDLTQSTLRSVAAVHREFLKNIGAGASMSVSIVSEGRLWGLIICHHEKPRFVPYDVRLACVSIGELLALNLTSKERSEKNEQQANTQRLFADLEAIAAADPQFLDNQNMHSGPLLSFVSSIADGAVIRIDGRKYFVGVTPDFMQTRELFAWLLKEHAGKTFVTDNLSDSYPAGPEICGTCSGYRPPVGRRRPCRVLPGRDPLRGELGGRS